MYIFEAAMKLGNVTTGFRLQPLDRSSASAAHTGHSKGTDTSHMHYRFNLRTRTA
jgi:hypothetical protein